MNRGLFPVGSQVLLYEQFERARVHGRCGARSPV